MGTSLCGIGDTRARADFELQSDVNVHLCWKESEDVVKSLIYHEGTGCAEAIIDGHELFGFCFGTA